MTGSLSLGLVCFRLRPEIVGGAEHLTMRLGAELAALGHRVEFLTTTATTISQPDRWRVFWEEDRLDAGPGTMPLRASDGSEHHLPVRRLKLARPRPPFRLARRLQQFEEETQARLVDMLRNAGESELEQIALSSSDRWELGPGWHLPEFSETGCRRWTTESAALIAAAGLGAGTIGLRGYALGPCRVWLERLGESSDAQSRKIAEMELAPGSFDVGFEVPRFETSLPGAVALRIDPTRQPRGEARRLGLLIEALDWTPAAGGIGHRIDLHETFTEAQLLRGLPDEWEAREAKWEAQGWVDVREARLLGAWSDRCRTAGKIFDKARGPNVRFLKRRLKKFARGKDALFFAGMPFATVSWPEHLPPDAPPHWILPFRHAEDPYYDWPQYDAALDRADGSLLLSAAELADMPSEIQERATVIGGGVDLPDKIDWPTSEARRAARRALDLPEGALIVLGLGRKSPGKGYLNVAAGVEEAHRRLSSTGGGEALYILAGPDEDGLPVPGARTRHLGRVDEKTKRLLFEASDLLAFFSQSESFGLVMLEAWAAGCPVLAGDRCGAVAEVAEVLGAPIASGKPGEIADALLDWRATSEADKEALWRRGLDAIRARYTWREVAQRAIGAVEALRASDAG